MALADVWRIGQGGPMQRIVVGVDESEGSAAGLAWAAREKQLRGAELTAIMAWGYLDQHHEDDGRDESWFDPDYHEDDAARALRAIVNRVLGAEEAGQVACAPVKDLPARALLEAAADADLLVVGARGLGGFRGLLLGSVSQRCVQRAPCPIAVVRTDVASGVTTSHRERIVVGIDGSDTAQRALHWALDEGRARQATVDVVHAWSPPYLDPYPLAPVPADRREIGQRGARVIEGALADADTRDLPGSPRAVTMTDSPAKAILETAAGADLVVVGSRCRTTLAGLVLGSVSQQVVEHAPCTVVVVPPTPEGA